MINVGVSGPGVVKHALAQVRGADFETLCETIKKTAFKVTRVGQLVAQEASRRLGVPFGIVDLSLAPTPAIGDSVADILCEIGLEYAGAPGTTAALALLNDQVKKGGVMASSYVGGLSGAFIPVSEDQGMINAVLANALDAGKTGSHDLRLLCGAGHDRRSRRHESLHAFRYIADEMAIGMINSENNGGAHHPGDRERRGRDRRVRRPFGLRSDYAGKSLSCEAFISRKGRIPAPIHSLKTKESPRDCFHIPCEKEENAFRTGCFGTDAKQRGPGKAFFFRNRQERRRRRRAWRAGERGLFLLWRGEAGRRFCESPGFWHRKRFPPQGNVPCLLGELQKDVQQGAPDPGFCYLLCFSEEPGFPARTFPCTETADGGSGGSGLRRRPYIRKVRDREKLLIEIPAQILREKRWAAAFSQVSRQAEGT